MLNLVNRAPSERLEDCKPELPLFQGGCPQQAAQIMRKGTDVSSSSAFQNQAIVEPAFVVELFYKGKGKTAPWVLGCISFRGLCRPVVSKVGSLDVPGLRRPKAFATSCVD